MSEVEKYLISFHREELSEILTNSDVFRYYSVNINFIELTERNIGLARALSNDPDGTLDKWDAAAVTAQLTIMKQLDVKCILKPKVHCRVFYLAHLARHSGIFPGNKDAEKFLQISGTVMRITATKLLEFQRNYVCATCKRSTIVKANYERKYIIKQPTKCQNPEGCGGTNLVHLGELDTDNCKDYQEIKIQEQVNKLGTGSIPNTIWVTLEDDLVDSCQPGDDITVCGIVKRRFGEFSLGKRPDIDLVIKAIHVQVDTNSISLTVSTPQVINMFNHFWEKYAENPLDGRDIILKSLCSQIYGLYPVKLAMAVVLAGGCSVEDTALTGVRTRSESHLLLIGDPGTGKSQLLRFASKLIPRAVLTTGAGSTAAGLTVTATMEHGEWQLEAGALVMADGGVCCIDEFNSMKEHDRTTIHEAMEQQSISVAKASIVCKLNTRCSILAACNPKGNLDPTQPLSMNVALPSPLLSRFDLIMLLRDTVNQEWDEKVIDYILNGGNNLSRLTDFGLWPIHILQSYFRLIKKFQPKLSEDSETVLSTYYNIQRRVGSRNKARTTVRLLESLIRLSQGHARLMYHEKVLVVDSIYAVFLIDVCMEPDSSLFNLNLPANSVFPERTKLTYRNLLETILNKMQLYQLLEKEINQLKENESGTVQSRFFANKSENAAAQDNEHVQAIFERKQDQSKTETAGSNTNREEIAHIGVDSSGGSKEKDSDIFKNLGTQFPKVSSNPNNLNQLEQISINKNNSEEHQKIIKTSTSGTSATKIIDLPEASNIQANSEKLDSNESRNKEGNLKILTDFTSNSLVNNIDSELLKDCGIQSKPKKSNDCKKYSCKVPNNLYNFGSSKTNSSVESTSVKEDLEMLKLIPCAGDRFNVDLEMDWNSEGTDQGSSNFTSFNNSNDEMGKNTNMFNCNEDIDFNL